MANNAHDDLWAKMFGIGVVGAIAYWGVILPIENSLKSKPDPNTTAVATETATAGTPFDPTFYQTQGKQVTIMTSSYAAAFAKTIYDALNTWFFNDFNSVMGVFQQLQTKSQVSFLADYFQKTYGKSLLTWLEYANGNEPTSGTGSNIFTGALLGGGLTDAQTAQIISYVNGLPNT